jgi:DegV family protein with EDD domain
MNVLHDAAVINASDTAVVIDSTADLPDYAERFDNLRMVPLTVRFGDEPDLRDHIDLDADAFYSRLALSSEPPRTSAPAPQAFADTYRQLLDGPYRHVVSVHISGKLSATVQSARLGAEGLGGAVTVVDAQSASAGTALCALGVEALLARGTTVEEVVAYGERFGQTAHCIFSVETLDYLQRGGRIGRAQALVGGLLGVRPILGLVDGEVVALARVRGMSKVLRALVDQFEAGAPADVPVRVAIAHAQAPEQAAALAQAVRDARPRAAIELLVPLGPVIGTYGGPGTIGLLWIAEPGTGAQAPAA